MVKYQSKHMQQNTKSSLGLVNIITGLSDGFILVYMVGIIAFPIFYEQLIYIFWIALAVAIIGGIIYGLSRYFGEINEIKHHHPELSKTEIEKEYALLKHIGIEDQLNDEMQLKMQEERELWLKEVIENDLGWEKENKKRAMKSGIQTGIGFFLAGLISLICILVILVQFYSLGLSGLVFWMILVPILFLFILGGLKAKFLGKSFWRGATISLIYGLVMIVIAILIALFIIKMQG